MLSTIQVSRPAILASVIWLGVVPIGGVRGEGADPSAATAVSGLVVSPSPFPDDFMARTRIGREIWSTLIARAALTHQLPPAFLMRVVARESGFNPSSISKAGALGIAQFMPGTAVQVGLRDPFDPAEAVRAAAAHLRDLRARFGNLGLAAAAYNAGPARVAAWLAGGDALPAETVSYVLAVSGQSVEHWRPAVLPGIQPARPPVKRVPRRAGKGKAARPSSSTVLCQIVNSTQTPCVVRKSY